MARSRRPDLSKPGLSGMTPDDLQALADRRVTQTELAERLGVSQPSIAKHIKKLRTAATAATSVATTPTPPPASGAPSPSASALAAPPEPAPEPEGDFDWTSPVAVGRDFRGRADTAEKLDAHLVGFAVSSSLLTLRLVEKGLCSEFQKPYPSAKAVKDLNSTLIATSDFLRTLGFLRTVTKEKEFRVSVLTIDDEIHLRGMHALGLDPESADDYNKTSAILNAGIDLGSKIGQKVGRALIHSNIDLEDENEFTRIAGMVTNGTYDFSGDNSDDMPKWQGGTAENKAPSGAWAAFCLKNDFAGMAVPEPAAIVTEPNGPVTEPPAAVVTSPARLVISGPLPEPRDYREWLGGLGEQKGRRYLRQLLEAMEAHPSKSASGAALVDEIDALTNGNPENLLNHIDIE